MKGLLAGALATAAGACGGGPELPDPVLGAVPSTAQLFYDNLGAIQDSTRMVVRDEPTFRDLWRRATSLQTSPAPMPGIDFDDSMVLVVAAGRMTPEDRIRVDSVGVLRERIDGEVRDVFTAIVVTRRGCGRFQSEAYPLEIVRVRRFSGPVRFRDRSEQETNCDTGP